MEAAVEWLKRSPFLAGEVEVRQVLEAGDFAAELTPDLKEREEQLRNRVERKKAS